jgi:glycosyltransferase involved in cell wall biosynthesis
MKIAFITYEYPPDTGKGGIGTYTQQIASFLSSNSFNIHVFAGSHSRNEVIDEKGVIVHWIKCEGPDDFQNKVLSVFTAENELHQFDIIESPEIHANALQIKNSFPHIPLVVRLHAPNHLVESLKKRYITFFQKLRFFFGALRRLKWNLGYWRKYKKVNDRDYQFTLNADYITAPSNAMKDWVVRNWNIAPDKITVIANIFIPPNQLLNIPIVNDYKYKTVFFFGRLNVLKGLVTATKVMKKILLKYPDWKFVVVGDDGNSTKKDLTMKQWMMSELKSVDHQVLFHEGVSYDQLPNFIKQSEIVLLPSLFESFSYTCAEAMSAGKVVVGSNIGGMSDLIEDSVSGFLVNPEDENSQLEILNKIITNNELRLKVSKNARNSINNKSKIQKQQAGCLDFYKHIISNN